MTNENIRAITHFTTETAAVAILEAWRRDLVRGDLADIPSNELGGQEVIVRMYSRSGMNDPLEQKSAGHGEDVTIQKQSDGTGEQVRQTFPDDLFMWCGSRLQSGEKGERANRLDMWRAYGNDGRGVALTTLWDINGLRKQGLEILEVKYVSNPEKHFREANTIVW